MVLLNVKDVSLGYEGKIVAEGLRFSVHSGDYLCIVGENGSGKSTLMRLLLGLLTPISGEVARDPSLSHGIGYLAQRAEIKKDFPASVREVVSSGITPRGRLFLSKADKERIDSAMERVSVTDLAARPFSCLSGGQQQRVLLARALCATDTILFADEPVTGLDVGAAEEMTATFDRLHEDGVTIVMISHDFHMALDHATHILHLDKTPKFYGTVTDYLRSGFCPCEAMPQPVVYHHPKKEVREDE